MKMRLLFGRGRVLSLKITETETETDIDVAGIRHRVKTRREESEFSG